MNVIVYGLNFVPSVALKGAAFNPSWHLTDVGAGRSAVHVTIRRWLLSLGDTMHALLFIAVFLVIGILIASIPVAILGWCVWRLTRGLPIWLRLQITLIPTTLLAAISCTPFGGGEGGMMLPLGLILVLHFSDFFGFGGADLRDHVSQQAVTFLCVWGGMYFISMVVFCIYHFMKKGMSKHV